MAPAQRFDGEQNWESGVIFCPFLVPFDQQKEGQTDEKGGSGCPVRLLQKSLESLVLTQSFFIGQVFMPNSV